MPRALSPPMYTSTWSCKIKQVGSNFELEIFSITLFIFILFILAQIFKY